MNRITREELRNKLILREEVVLVEALPEKYWRESHLPGALQIDHDKVTDKAQQLLPDKEAEIVVYCASSECQNSSITALQLQNMGYKNVYEYVEGKKHWLAAGLPVQ
jgi:rhodanese-related sulfurtransferase